MFGTTQHINGLDSMNIPTSPFGDSIRFAEMVGSGAVHTTRLPVTLVNLKRRLVDLCGVDRAMPSTGEPPIGIDRLLPPAGLQSPRSRAPRRRGVAAADATGRW